MPAFSQTDGPSSGAPTATLAPRGGVAGVGTSYPDADETIHTESLSVQRHESHRPICPLSPSWQGVIIPPRDRNGVSRVSHGDTRRCLVLQRLRARSVNGSRTSIFMGCSLDAYDDCGCPCDCRRRRVVVLGAV